MKKLSNEKIICYFSWIKSSMLNWWCANWCSAKPRDCDWWFTRWWYSISRRLVLQQIEWIFLTNNESKWVIQFLSDSLFVCFKGLCWSKSILKWKHKNKSALFEFFFFGMLLAANMVFHFTQKQHLHNIYDCILLWCFFFNKNKRKVRIIHSLKSVTVINQNHWERLPSLLSKWIRTLPFQSITTSGCINWSCAGLNYSNSRDA